MKNTRNKIGDILREGLNENKFEDFEFYIFEKSFSYAPLFDIPEQTKERTLNKLENIRQKRIQLKSNLENINKVNHFGELLLSYIEYFNVDTKSLLSTFDIKYEMLKPILSNNVNITTLDVKPFIKLLKTIKASLEDSVELFSKTYKLFCIEPIYKESLARYKPGESPIIKEKSMRKGFNELMLLADKKKELKARSNCDKSKDELLEFIENFKKEFQHE